MLKKIRQVLNSSPDSAKLIGDFAVAGIPREEGVMMPAAVLVPLVDRVEELTVLLTRRTDHLLHHPGQVSFPGGQAEGHDTGPIETALREAEEEIGLQRRYVEIAGFLDSYQTVTGFLITPVVGFIKPSFELNPDPFEVAEVFEVPLSFVLDPRHHERRSMNYKGQERRFYVLPYKDYYIWGATAAMLVNLAKKVTSP